MFDKPVQLQTPGLFITGTDTEVGKTVVTCAIARALRRSGQKVGVCKPLASGCKREGDQWVGEDAAALHAAVGEAIPMQLISPVSYEAPVAPAVAAQMEGRAAEFEVIAQSLRELDGMCDQLLVEGVGGLLVPLDPDDPECTVLDMIVALGLPVVVVTRAGLGTLNHTAMTCRVLGEAGCRVAGLVVNRHGIAGDDVSVATNCDWLARMTGAKVVAVLPAAADDEAIDQVMGSVDWPSLMHR